MQLRIDHSMALLDDIAAITESGPDPVPLSPDAYAEGHAAFERRSDQRALITALLSERVARREGPLSVLSVGCGDGSVDAPLARAATERDPHRRVRYVGVEPHRASADAFTRRMAALAAPGLDHEAHVTTFEDAPLAESFDVVTFVHSMYYVADLTATLRHAHALLRPGGELLVLSAPKQALNRLAGVLAPPHDGHPQWFSDDVAAAFATLGPPPPEVHAVDARLDLHDAGPAVLDFTVQAVIDDAVRPLVLDYLDAISLPGDGLSVAHPVDLYRLTRA